MSQTKNWLPQQDQILLYLRQDQKITKWSVIAQKLQHQYKMSSKSGKQCRQRYYNYLDCTITKIGWSKEEQKKLFSLHDQVGNKWALIAQTIQGRTDNCVKNHFYSKLRKSVRKLNKIITDHLRKQYKEIKINALYKIVEANEQRHKQNSMVDEEIHSKSLQLKNKLLNFCDDLEQNDWTENPEGIRQIIKDLHDFNKSYKRQSKKIANKNSLDLLKVEVRPRSQSNGNQSQEELQGSFVFSESERSADQNCTTEKPKKLALRKGSQDMKIQQQNNCVDQLRLAGIAQSDNLLPHLFLNKKDPSKQSKFSDKSYEEHMFFDDSEIHIKLLGFNNPFGNVKKCSDIEHDFSHY